MGKYGDMGMFGEGVCDEKSSQLCLKNTFWCFLKYLINGNTIDCVLVSVYLPENTYIQTWTLFFPVTLIVNWSKFQCSLLISILHTNDR